MEQEKNNAFQEFKSNPDQYETEEELAGRVQCSVSKLRNDRSAGRGYPYYKFGRSVRYKKSECLEFEVKCRIVPQN